MACLFLRNITPRQRLRLFWLLLVFILISVFLFLKIVPFGQITYIKNYDRFWQPGKGFIFNFTPVERVAPEGALPRLIGDPVYFSVFTPRTFSDAKLTVSYYSNLSENTPLIEAGVLVNKQVWHYDLKPLQNKILDDLMIDWHYLESDGLVLLQKNKKYESVEKFLSDLQAADLKDCSGKVTACLATYNFNPNYQFKLGQVKNTANNFNIPLKGNHVFWLYLNDGFWQFKANFLASSPETRNDPIKLILTKNQKKIKEVVLEREAVDWQIQNLKELILEGNFVAGLYKLEINISDDVIIENIYSSSGLMVLAHKFWPASYDGQLKVFTDANYLQVKVLDPANLQNIIFADQSFAVSKPYEQFEFKVQGRNLKEISLSKGGIILENNSLFSLSAEDFFNPLVKKVDRHFTFEPELNYIIANYKTPSIDAKDKKLNIASAEFKMKGTHRERGRYNFMLSVPGLKTEDGETDYLEIKEIKIEFKGRTLWQKIFKLDE